ncbi:hypothetical protein E2C01_052694 [Portunus trituberculatus]|uniref:Uncharacterized protein n=1 Tax=Portunus trituberculatus TaxID=210409 RepID=A0A5B7GN66_PORTR|nr:hypothetical protein [Portunus trituberculatus]
MVRTASRSPGVPARHGLRHRRVWATAALTYGSQPSHKTSSAHQPQQDTTLPFAPRQRGTSAWPRPATEPQLSLLKGGSKTARQRPSKVKDAATITLLAEHRLYLPRQSEAAADHP